MQLQLMIAIFYLMMLMFKMTYVTTLKLMIAQLYYIQTEATDTTADDSSILHNEGIGQYDISNNPTADDSSILHDEVNGQHDLTSLSNIISKPGLKIGCLNIRGLLGKIDEIRATVYTELMSI